MTMSEGLHIVCAHCDRVNRVPQGKTAARAICGHCGLPLFDGHPAEVDDASLIKQMERSDIPLVVDFWAQWCGPCRAMAPAFEQAAAALEPAARFLKVDVDRNRQVAGKLGVQGIPALFVIRGGEVVERRTGAMNAVALRDWIRNCSVSAPTS